MCVCVFFVIGIHRAIQHTNERTSVVCACEWLRAGANIAFVHLKLPIVLLFSRSDGGAQRQEQQQEEQQRGVAKPAASSAVATAAAAAAADPAGLRPTSFDKAQFQALAHLSRVVGPGFWASDLGRRATALHAKDLKRKREAAHEIVRLEVCTVRAWKNRFGRSLRVPEVLLLALVFVHHARLAAALLGIQSHPRADNALLSETRYDKRAPMPTVLSTAVVEAAASKGGGAARFGHVPRPRMFALDVVLR